MKTILCYGDSNTWGYIPTTKKRYPLEKRWTGILQRELGEDYRVIEEGLNGRTTRWDDSTEGMHKNGKSYLLPCVESHRPIDLVILMLGTNDLKKRFALSAAEIASGVSDLCEIIKSANVGPEGSEPEILLVSPIRLGISDGESFVNMFGTGGNQKSKEFSVLYQNIASEKKLHFMDAATIAETSQVDSIHLEASEHEKLGMAFTLKVKEIFSK